jgi:putative phosphoribosyl transferase
MDLLLVRKLGVPGQPELAMGAIAGAGAGSLYVDAQAVALHGVTPAQLSEVIERERAELVRREALYLGSRKRVGVAGRTVIVIDDGIATGSTMRAALMALRASQPEWIVVASPVAPPEAQDRIGTAADEFVCLRSPADFASVGQYYQDFSQTTDDEVLALLARRTGCV